MKVLAVLMLLLELLFVQRFFNVNKFTDNQSIMPVFFFLLFMNAGGFLKIFSPVCFTIFLTTFIILFNTKDDNEKPGKNRLYASGIIIGIVSLIDSCALGLLLYLMFSLFANRYSSFKEIVILISGVLMSYIYVFTCFFLSDSLPALHENGEFYVYDTGFRLQGEAPHLLMKAIHGFDQREMLIRFALTGSEGDVDLKNEDDTRLRGKWAATLWFLLKEGKIDRIEGLENLESDERVVANIQRLHVGDVVQPEWIGNEKQVLTRMYLVCDSKLELADALKYYMNTVRVLDENGNNLLLKGFDVNKALELK